MRTIVLAALVVLSNSATHYTQEKPRSDQAFERLKGLEGTWEATEKGTSRTFTADYTLTGGGTVVIETLGGMSTAYHLDNGTLMLTHYCGAGNQPRMRVKAIEDGARRITFGMYDITNLRAPDAYRSTSLEVVFHDDGSIDLAYGGMSGSGTRVQTFKLLRRMSTATR